MEKSTRRRFLQAAAVATIPATGATETAAAGAPPATADEALISLIRLRFKHLNDDQIRAIERSLRGDLAAAEVLKRMPLDPADEPSTIFVADLAE